MMVSLEERLDAVERMIKMPSFRENKGLGNEVGYYVFDYPANQELIVRERIQYMKSKNSKGTKGTQGQVYCPYLILSITLFDTPVTRANCLTVMPRIAFSRLSTWSRSSLSYL